MKTIQILIEAEYGSKFQKEAFESTLELFLFSILTYYKMRHTKNGFNVQMDWGENEDNKEKSRPQKERQKETSTSKEKEK